MSGEHEADLSQIQRMSMPEIWDRVAAGYSRSSQELNAEFARAAVVALSPEANMRVLDLACGPGSTAVLLAPRVKEIIALDFSRGMLRELQSSIDSAGITNIRPTLGDGLNLTFSESEFDVILSMFGITYFSNRTRGMGEAYRVLKPGGKLLMASWVADAESSTSKLILDTLQVAAPESGLLEVAGARLPDPKLLQLELEQTGFNDVHITPVQNHLEFGDVWDFWHVMVSGSPGVAALRAKVSEDEWRDRSNRAADYLKQRFGEGSMSLDARGVFVTGTKPA